MKPLRTFIYLFRLRLSSAMTYIGIRLGPADYRRWVNAVMEFGAQKLGGPNEENVMHRVIVDVNDSGPKEYDFSTAAEAHAFELGLQVIGRAGGARMKKTFVRDPDSGPVN